MSLNLSNLTTKEKVFLTELANQLVSPPVISPDTLKSLKPGVLQVALAARAGLDRRKILAINKILDKIIYMGAHAQVLNGEYADPKIYLENSK